MDYDSLAISLEKKVLGIVMERWLAEGMAVSNKVLATEQKKVIHEQLSNLLCGSGRARLS